MAISTWFVEKCLQPIFRRNSLLGDKPYFDKNDFVVAGELEQLYPLILQEFYGIKDRVKDFAPFQTISPDQTYISNDKKWKMFFLKAGGLRFDRNCEELPFIMSILDKYPDIISAYLSVLGPRKMLNPHHGPWSGVLRMHLGLVIPTDGKGCTLVNGKIPYRWKAGEVVVFDDTYEHFAVNGTDSDRIILFLDVLRPLPWFWHAVNKSVIYCARFLPYFRTPIKRHTSWEREFYGH